MVYAKATATHIARHRKANRQCQLYPYGSIKGIAPSLED
jgi:hypothetical protein